MNQSAVCWTLGSTRQLSGRSTWSEVSGRKIQTIEYETLVNGEPVHVFGQTTVVFHLASGDCREIMVVNVDVMPDVDGLVLGMEWMRDNIVCGMSGQAGSVPSTT